jgi:hypothetical protein
MARQHTLFFQAVFNLPGDSAKLPLGVTGTDYKIIGEAGDRTGIQYDDSACLLFAGNVGGFVRQF